MRNPTRRQFIKTSAGITAALLTSRKIIEAASRPNIIFLLTDDQRWNTLGCMGNTVIQTPNIDALAAAGVVFENAFVTTSICAPSRASYLSGQYVCRHGVNDFQKTLTDEQWHATYPALLREAGYATGFVGKYGVGSTMPEDRFDFWRGYAGQGKYEQTDANGNYKHQTQIDKEAALEFLRSYGGKQPFCLSVSFKAPHAQDGDPRQFIYEPRYENLYDSVEIVPPETAAEKYFQQFPDFFRNNNEGRNRWQIRFSNPELYQRMVRGYYRLITGVDRVVGAICTELEEKSLAENTVIVFASDNGFYLGDYGLAGKWYGHDPSIRIPMIICDPRLPDNYKGTRRQEMALNIDVAPTLLDIAGIPLPDAMQGQSLLPLLENKPAGCREDFYYEHTFEHPAIPKSEGVVGIRYKYLRYYEQSPVYEELYDRETDPLETNNLAENPEHRELLEQLRLRCDELKQRYQNGLT